MDLFKCFNFPLLTLCVLVSSAVCHVVPTIYADDPYSEVMSSPEFMAPEEPYTNMTIDQLITQAYGSAEESEQYMSDHFMAPDGNMLAELDMRLDPEQFSALYGEDNTSNRKKRKATRPLRYRWTNNLIPYQFAPGHFSANEVYTVKEALQEWSDATCLTFRPATHSDRNKIRFQNGAGCNSMLGMTGGTQAINLQSPSCRYKGLYLHEVGHAIGLVHEHQLPDRDEYIYILYNNVSPSLRIWFNKISSREVNQYGVPYEYSSVMHYGITAFSVDGRRQTIRAKDQSKEHLIGRVYLKGLSFSDKKVVNLMYQCNKHCTANPSCKDPGYLDKNCNCVCPDNVDCGTGGGGGTRGTTSATGRTTTAPVTTPRVIACSNIWPGSQCRGWAQRGECNRNPAWMLVNCAKSCNSCPTAPPTATTTTTTTTAPTTTDPTTTAATTTATTATTAATTSGSPTTPTTTYMPSPPPSSTTIDPTATTTTTQATTPTTTSMPSPPPSTTTTETTTAPTTTTPTTTARPCVNEWSSNYDCSNWARSGECSRNRAWMRQHCARACNACSGGGGGGGGTNCQNRHNNCAYWARSGYCSSYPYMNRNCRKACNMCN